MEYTQVGFTALRNKDGTFAAPVPLYIETTPGVNECISRLQSELAKIFFDAMKKDMERGKANV